MRNIKTLSAAIVAMVALSSCNKDPEVNYKLPPAVQDAGKVTLEFKNYFGTDAFALNQSYNSNGQQVSFTEAKYIITNISMIKDNGTEVVYNHADLNKAGFVIDQADATSQSFVLDTIAAGNYKYIRFGLGVRESLNSLSSAAKTNPTFASLTQKKGMQWQWSGNFIFAKFSGTYGGSNPLAIQLGNGKEWKRMHSTWSNQEGIARVDTIYKTGTTEIEKIDKWSQSSREAFRYVTLELPNGFAVTKDANKTITIKADLDKLLNGANKITLTGKIPEGQNNMDQALRIANNIGGRKSISNKGIRIRQIKAKNTDADVDLSNVTDNTIVVDNPPTATVDSKGMFSVLSVQ